MTPEQEAMILSVRPLAWHLAATFYPQTPLSREDLAQAGLAELCRNVDAFEQRGPFAPWAGAVMRHAMLAELKAMTWRRQARDLGRVVSTYDRFDIVAEHGLALVGESGGYREPAPPRRRVRPIPGPPRSCSVCAGPIPENRSGRGGPPIYCSQACSDRRRDDRRTLRRRLRALQQAGKVSVPPEWEPYSTDAESQRAILVSMAH